jgi:hypothetical protein
LSNAERFGAVTSSTEPEMASLVVVGFAIPGGRRPSATVWSQIKRRLRKHRRKIVQQVRVLAVWVAKKIIAIPEHEA